MSLKQIRQLRAERKHYIEQYTHELQQIKQDERYAPEYKDEQIKEIESKLNEIRYGHDKQIRELINAGIADAKNNIERAGIEALSEKELLQQLLLDNRIKDIEERAKTEYKDDPQELFNKITNEVNSGSIVAQAYINAYYSIVNDPMQSMNVRQLEEQHKVNMMNGTQKAYYKELQSYENELNEYIKESEHDSFTRSLMGNHTAV